MRFPRKTLVLALVAAAVVSAGVLLDVRAGRSVLESLTWAVAMVAAAAALFRTREKQSTPSSCVPGSLASETSRGLQDVLDVMPEAVIVARDSGEIRFVNAQAAETFGYSPEQFSDRTLESLLPDRAQSTLRQHQKRYCDTPVLVPLQAGFTPTAKRADGSEFPAEIALRPVTIDGTLHIVAVIRDLSRIHSLSDQLRQSQKMEAVGQLAGGIAHDFNNLLTIMRANAELLELELPTSATDARAALGDVLQATCRGSDMVRKLLAFSRREQLELEELEIESEVSEAVSFMRHVVPPTIRIELECEPGLPCIMGDGSAIQQILLNLATNARDAMRAGGGFAVRVAMANLTSEYRRSHPWMRPGEYVHIEARDQGCGMDSSTLARVFEPFFTTKPTDSGTGLGMSMVFGLMKQHKGYIDVESSVGVGTTVHLYFPVHGQRVPVRRAPAASVFPRGTETILIVDDDIPVRDALCRTLAWHGYHVVVAADGVEGLKVFQETPGGVDLVISDDLMPRMTGVDLHATLIALGFRIPFLLVSGTTRPGEDLSPRVGFSFLRKPWSLDELLPLMRQILDNHSAAVAA